MLEKIRGFGEELGKSTQFQGYYEHGAVARADMLGEVQTLLRARLGSVPASLIKLYQTCDGLTLRWTYNKLTHPDYITSGGACIFHLGVVLRSIKYAPDDLIPFDAPSDTAHVMLRLDPGRLSMVYCEINSRVAFPLATSIDEYLHLLDECRALYPWRELFVVSPKFKLDTVLRDKFFADLNRLFADADPKLFETPPSG
jgi:hypothetical protein